MWFNAIDACYHQLVLHMGYTHLVAEGIYMAIKRTLSSTHPVYQLLMPHLNQICLVNSYRTFHPSPSLLPLFPYPLTHVLPSTHFLPSRLQLDARYVDISTSG